ncbi:diacylglycerol kinase catalytic domain-containing protein [Lysobacter solisilvae (ex Woo and Kim 2020)]|uniref:Sugar kinase n=1 Tax=Agrilutibacter terrestris TaxID=2865112 RepID=A0A7H0G000_9GAMM|nr:sugar kinase [Lysobacter terrestris]QNP41616.1 sugar kinase [Lysobacter terrestris]
MEPLSQRIVLIVRKTRLEDLTVRFNTVEQARFYIEHLGADFGDYEAEHRIYQQAVLTAETSLRRFGRVQKLDRSFLPNFLFPPDALVVVLGQDGLVANTLKYLSGQPVIGVNPDPARWDGVLLPFKVGDLASITLAAQTGTRPTRSITMARARLSDGQELHAVNDLFIGPRSHVSARYEIQIGGRSETHSSSGLIVSTGLGSTGWFRSLLAGAAGIAGQSMRGSIKELREKGFPWDADHLHFTVREPFPSKTTQTDLVFGIVTRDQPLRLLSQMAGYGVIFSDGIETDFLEFNSGMVATIDVAQRHGNLVL